MTSVHYLTPGTSAWTERISDDTEDLIQDPFWRIKQSSVASKDAIVIRCAAGVIERSTDGGENWTDVTPTSNPPNDAGDSPAPTVGNCTFNQLDASFSDQDVFVAMVTWQNASSEWRTWLYYSDDNFATNGTWKSIIDTSAVTFSWNSLNLVAGGPTETRWVDQKGSFFYDSHNIVKLTNTKMVVHYIDRDASSPSDAGYCKVIDIQSNGTLIIGSEQGPYNTFTDPDWNEIDYGSIFSWGSQKFALVTREYDQEHAPTGTYKALLRQCSVSGSNITFGDAIEFGSFASSNTWIDAAIVKLPGFNNDGLFVYTGYDSTLNEYPGYARIITEGVSEFTLRTEYQWETANSPGSGPMWPVVFDDTYAAIFYSVDSDIGDGIDRLYAKTVTITGFTLTFTPRDLMVNARVGIISGDRLSDSKAILAYNLLPGVSINSAVISRSGTTLTVENTQTVTSTDLAYVSVHAISSSRWAVFYESSGAAYEIFARIGYLTGTYTHTYGTEQGLDNSPTNDLWAQFGQFASPEFIISYMEDEADGSYNAVRAITGTLDSGYEIKGLGVSIGKGIGNIAWITAWDSTNGLILIGINLTTFAIEYALNLGLATESEMNAKTWIAYPFAMWGGTDTQVMIFGRMQAGDGSPVHVIYPAGFDFAVVEDSWGANHCGSLIRFPGGLIYAIRNDGVATSLYTGTVAGLNLKSVLPFNSGVDPHGMTIDPIDGTIVACAQVAGSTLVALCPYPYSSWFDITTDHGLTEGVNAVAVL